MKDERVGFTKAILAEPDDDAHRLVFADWLDDHGDADRAAFIRAQCDLARLPIGDVRRVALEMRSRVLLQQHRAAWLDGLAKWIDRTYVTFRRGFPWSIDTTRKTFLRNASALAGRTTIQEATFDAVGIEDVTSLVGLPVAARLRSIRTHSDSFAELHDVLTACTGLTALALLYTCDDGDVGSRFGELLALPAVRGVSEFVFRLRDEGMAARRAADAVAAAEFSALHALSLEMRGFGRETLAALLRAPFMRSLKALSLAHWCDADALEMLGAAEGLAGVRSLRLFLPKGAGSAFAKLAGSPHLAGLTDLSIAGPDAECAAALDSALTERLGTLDVWSWNFSGGKRVQVLPRLVEAGRLAGLSRLRVRDNQSTDADVAALADSPHLPALIHLELDERQLTEAGLLALARSPHFPALRAVTALHRLAGIDGIDVAAVGAVQDRIGGRFAVLVPSPGWASCSPEERRLGAY